VYAGGDRYEGAWAAGVRCGKGTCLYAIGDVYQGQARSLRKLALCKSARPCVCRSQGTPALRGYAGLSHCSPASCNEPSGERRLRWCPAQQRIQRQADRGTLTGARDIGHARAPGVAGDWAGDKRHGQGTCRFADGTVFRGEWEADAWVQSLAEPRLCRLSGLGLARALAGTPAAFDIEVRLGAAHWPALATDPEPAFRSMGDASWRSVVLPKTPRTQ